MTAQHLQLFVRVPAGDHQSRDRLQEALRMVDGLDCSVAIVDIGSTDADHLAYLQSQEFTRDPLDPGFWSSLRSVTVERRLGSDDGSGFVTTDRPDLLPGFACEEETTVRRAA